MWQHYFSILFFLFQIISCPVHAQLGIPYEGMNRLTIAPITYPYVPLKSEFSSKNDHDDTIDASSSGFEGFLRITGYRPTGGLNFGLDLGFFKHSYMLSTPADEFQHRNLSLAGGIISPHATYTFTNIENIRQLMLNFGVSYRPYVERAMRSNQTLPDGRSFADVNYELPYLRKSSTFLQLGVGMVIERPSIRTQKVYPATLQVQAYFPLLNQAELIKDDPGAFPEGDQSLQGLTFKSIHLGVQYSQALDILSNNNRAVSDKQTTYLQRYNREVGLTPPLVNYDWPDKRIEGVFSLTGVVQGGQDSLSVGPDSTSMDLSPSVGIKAAYTLHFLGNNRGLFNNRTGVPFYGKWFLYDFFVSGGVHQQNYRLSNSSSYFSSRQLFGFTEGGMRLGAIIESEEGGNFSLILLLQGGAGIRYPLNAMGLFRVGDDQLYEITRQYLFLGVQINDLLSIRLTATPVRPAFRQGKFWARTNLEVGFGF